MGISPMGISPMGIYPIGNSGSFLQGKAAATKSRYPTLINGKLHVGSIRVSKIHRILTWTTGSLTHGGWAHQQRVITTFLTRKKTSQIVLVLLSNDLTTD